MYNPAFNTMAAADIVPTLRALRFGHLTTAVDQLQATALPFVINDDATIVRAHFARRRSGHSASAGGKGVWRRATASPASV